MSGSIERRDPFHPELHLERFQQLVFSTRPGITATIPRQLRYRPGRSLTASFTLRDNRPGNPHERAVVQVAERLEPGVSAVARSDRGHPIAVFSPDSDPRLPGLAVILDRRRRRQALCAMGLPGSDGSARLLSYRPLRRAVVQLTLDRGPVYVKVVRPERVESLVAVTALLLSTSSVPVPPVLGSTGDGIVVFGAVSGTPMRTVLEEDARLPDVEEVVRLLDGLPTGLLDHPLAICPVSRATDHAAWLAAVDGRFRSGIDLAARIVDTASGGDHGPVVPVHGDFYEHNLILQGGEIVGLVDLDGAGSGHRIDDLATMLGHLSVLALRPSHRRAGQLGAAWLQSLDGQPGIDRRSLRVHVAAVVLGLATGCFRVLERNWRDNTHTRLGLAAEWLRAAERM